MSKCEYKNCKNCIHYDCCLFLKNKPCLHYKDKSLIVELPCKVEDEVWFETYENNGSDCVGIQPHKVDRIDIYIVVGEKKLVETKLPIWAFGKTVFTNKEDAIAKLKEIEGE